MANVDIFEAFGGSAGSSLDVQAQLYIRDALWPGSTNFLSEHVSYFRYLQWTIDTIMWQTPVAQKALFAIRTFQDVATVVRCMIQHPDESRSELAARLQDHFPQSTRDCILRSMDLVIRLWMTLHVRSADCPIGPMVSNTTAVDWKSKQSLRNMVAANFPRRHKGQTLSAVHTSHIDPGFTVMNIRKLCRIEVEWTHTLHDHLKFDRSRRTLYIYPHKVCLLNHLKLSKVYPKDFLMETLKTLDLLFPYGDRNTESWLEQKGQSFYRTSSSPMQARASNLEEFQFWGQRLAELYHIFEQPPATVVQMWYDRRNPMQWYTFWLAGFIAVLSVVFGSLGTYIGFKQIQLAEQSIKISLAQVG